MGFRFSRRIRIFPGVRLNLSRSGVSTSVGSRGAWYTFGNGRRRATVGLPGTGVSYTQQDRALGGDRPAEASQGVSPLTVLLALVVTALVVWAVVR